MSTPANFNGAKPIIDPANAAMLLIDHQSGLFQAAHHRRHHHQRVHDLPLHRRRA